MQCLMGLVTEIGHLSNVPVSVQSGEVPSGVGFVAVDTSFPAREWLKTSAGFSRECVAAVDPSPVLHDWHCLCTQITHGIFHVLEKCNQPLGTFYHY